MRNVCISEELVEVRTALGRFKGKVLDTHLGTKVGCVKLRRIRGNGRIRDLGNGGGACSILHVKVGHLRWFHGQYNMSEKFPSSHGERWGG